MSACVHAWMVGYTWAKVYKHSEQHSHMHACVNTCRYIQPDIKKRLYSLVSPWSIMMIKEPSCTHACTCVFMHGRLLTHKQRCTSMQTSMRTCMCACQHMQVHTAWWQMWKRLYPLVSPWSIMMIKMLHVCMHARVCSCVDGSVHISKEIQAYRPACTQSMHVWTHAGTYRLMWKRL